MTVADTWPGGKDYATENIRQHTRKMSKTPYVMNKTRNRVTGTASSSSRPKEIADIQIRDELRCGDLGRIITLHGVAYEPMGGFGLRFEAYVAKTIAEYVLDNSSRGRVWLAERDKDLVGCVAIAEREQNTGQLRWVLVDPAMRGVGLGHRLVTLALDHCVERGLASVYLETTDDLPESMQLYEKLGFKVFSTETADLWDGTRKLIKMSLQLSRASA
jgi:N-acetylglutamate synthase-like GNAT family acetyltransferase